MNLLRTDLVRAWQNFYRVKGGESPQLANDVLSVVVLDDNSKGPYPPYRSWFAGRSIGAVAAQFSYFAIQNLDAIAISRSVVVIDFVIVSSSIANDSWVISQTNSAEFALASSSAVMDAAEEKEAVASPEPVIGNVLHGQTNQAAALAAGASHPGNGPANVSTRIEGPFTLGPQGIFTVKSVTLNVAVNAYARGRYYPTL